MSYVGKRFKVVGKEFRRPFDSRERQEMIGKEYECVGSLGNILTLSNKGYHIDFVLHWLEPIEDKLGHDTGVV